jgi:HSP20 family protein
MNTTIEKSPAPTVRQTAPAETIAPDVNIYETKEAYMLEAEMPGVAKDGLEITLEGSELTIVGRRHNEAAAGEPLFRERPLRDYQRTFELDPAIDAKRINARIEQGLLTLTLPKAERVKPQKITVSD